MTEADIIEVISHLVGAFGIGWTAGFLLHTFKKFTEVL